MRLIPAAVIQSSILFLGAQQGHAETLADAVRAAYETNPSFLQRQAAERALNETYVQARAGWRPTFGVQATVSENRVDVGSGQGTELVTDATGNLIPVGGGQTFSYNSGNATLRASQPIYTGGRVGFAVAAAQADIAAGRDDLRGAEVQLLQTVILAYADVHESAEVVAVIQADIAVLGQQVEQAEAKVELGQATQIDLAQSRAQLAAANAQLASAQGRVRNNEIAYATLVGHPPIDLAPVDDLPDLPATLDDAIADAETESPVLLRAAASEKAARYRMAEARAAKRPTVTANLSVGYSGAVAPFETNRFDRLSVGSLTVTLPLYSGGIVSSQIRQASEQDTAGQLALESTRREVVQNVSMAWSDLAAANANVASNAEQVTAARLASEGLLEQNRFGRATTLDLSIQQQQFRVARLSLIEARHEVFVARAEILAAVGRLSASRLAPGTQLYDPERALEKVDRSSRSPLEVLPRLLDHIGAPRP